MSRRREDMKGRREGGTFTPWPHAVLNAPSFIGLSPNAKRLAFDLSAAYRHGHNGDLCASRAVMRRRGWTSNSGLQKAIAELLAAGIIQQTRMGGLHQAALYGFTWIAIDRCGDKLDVPPTAVASGLWRRDSASRAHPSCRASDARREGRIAPLSGALVAVAGPPAGPIGRIEREVAALPAGTSEISPSPRPRIMRTRTAPRGCCWRRSSSRLRRPSSS